MQVITTTLEMTEQPQPVSDGLPEGARIEQCRAITTQFAKFLYAAVGSDWHWIDRLPWNDEQWSAALSAPGVEVWVLYCDGMPAGYGELTPAVVEHSTSVEITYFGLLPHAIGKGLGKALLNRVIAEAWQLPQRHDLPPAAKVWLHTCSLDGPHALANYQARGFYPVSTATHEQQL